MGSSRSFVTTTNGAWFLHKSTPRTQAMCLLANRILGINLLANTLFEKMAIALSQGNGISKHPYIVFDPKGVTEKNDIGRDRDI